MPKQTAEHRHSELRRNRRLFDFQNDTLLLAHRPLLCPHVSHPGIRPAGCLERGLDGCYLRGEAHDLRLLGDRLIRVRNQGDHSNRDHGKEFKPRPVDDGFSWAPPYVFAWDLPGPSVEQFPCSCRNAKGKRTGSNAKRIFLGSQKSCLIRASSGNR